VREGAGVPENGPEVEAIHGPKPGQHCKSELVESPRVAQRIFLREAKRAVDGGPYRRSPRYYWVPARTRVPVVQNVEIGVGVGRVGIWAVLHFHRVATLSDQSGSLAPRYDVVSCAPEDLRNASVVLCHRRTAAVLTWKFVQLWTEILVNTGTWGSLLYGVVLFRL
jgi:hypothetical protein